MRNYHILIDRKHTVNTSINVARLVSTEVIGKSKGGWKILSTTVWFALSILIFSKRQDKQGPETHLTRDFRLVHDDIQSQFGITFFVEVTKNPNISAEFRSAKCIMILNSYSASMILVIILQENIGISHYCKPLYTSLTHVWILT